MASFTDVVSNVLAKASDVQQILDALKGTIGKGIPIAITAVNDAISPALQVKNLDATNSKAASFYKADGSVLLQVDKNGVIVSPDGTAAAAAVVTLSSTQTLTNKTLTSPVITTPTGDMLTRIATVGPLVAPAATIDFTSIPQTYRHLKLVVYGRTTGAAETVLRVQVNGIVTASYYSQRILANGATIASDEELGVTTGARVGHLTGSSSPTSIVGAAEILIPNYAQANRAKPMAATGAQYTGLTTGLLRALQFMGVCDTAAAINRLTLVPTAGNFDVDSVAVLYGWS